jgi:hypothetical protein
MTLTVGTPTCGDAGSHEWVLRSIDFEDARAISVFECLLCGNVDHRQGGAR